MGSCLASASLNSSCPDPTPDHLGQSLRTAGGSGSQCAPGTCNTRALTWLKCKSPSPTPDQLNQELWGGVPNLQFNKSSRRVLRTGKV